MNTKGRITVVVTPEDITQGRASCSGCPIALAVKRASGCEEACVEGGTGLLLRAPGTTYDAVWIGVDFPTRTRIDTFITRFDEGEEVYPCAFEIEPYT